MSGISYDLTKIKAFVFDVDGVLSPSTIPLFPNGEPMRMMNVKDGFAMKLAIKAGYKIAIISGGKTDALKMRFDSLDIDDVYLGVKDKLPIYKEWLDKYNLNEENVLFMGDDIPDLQIMGHAGLPTAPKDACIDIISIAKYISPFSGGNGCARDVIEQVLRVNNKWVDNGKAFGW